MTAASIRTLLGQPLPAALDRRSTKEPPAMANESTQETRLDVREITPRERHPLIFSTFDNLPAGSSMLLVNDHDPKPLYYQLQAERAGQADWQYIESGPETWQVLITKKAA
jgi:uncharacterized protein (DUF2249 family)